MNTEQMRTAIAQGKDKSDWARVRREAQAGIEPAVDEDTVDASALIREATQRRKAGRPVGSGIKEPVALRLDRDVLAAFRAAGPGWQTRINNALHEWLKEHPPAR
jgi:uncharacterized protein (DUF4415 family)